MPLFVLGTLLALLAGGASAQESPRVFPTGRLVEGVASDRSPGQRYTIYLPSGYTASKPAPILYLMDPRGRARVPAKLFQAAAERYGYILFSSHNSQSDGPPEVTLKAMQAMWDDSHLWLAVDDSRVYVAGFSGTARMATLLAQSQRGVIAGIIAAGAGFHPSMPPTRDAKFSYFGTVGDADYNFHEIETLEHTLVSLEFPHRIERFEGPHSWMPAAVAMQAVEWMELRAMQAGTRRRDDALVQAWWKRDEETARAWMDQGRALDAARRFDAMARDYAGLRDVAGVTSLAEEIAGGREARARLKQRQAATRGYNEWMQYAMQAISNAFPEGALMPAIQAHELAGQLDLAHLKKEAAEGSAEERLEAQRRLNQMEVQLGFYLPHEAMESGELTRATYYLDLAVQIDPGSPVCWYLTAESFAHLNAGRDALAALRRALEAGFRDAARVESDPAFRKIRENPEFQDILHQIRTSGDTLDLPTVDRPPAPAPSLR